MGNGARKDGQRHEELKRADAPDVAPQIPNSAGLTQCGPPRLTRRFALPMFL